MFEPLCQPGYVSMRPITLGLIGPTFFTRPSGAEGWPEARLVVQAGSATG